MVHSVECNVFCVLPLSPPVHTDDDNLSDLMDAVVDMAAKWKSVGMSLRIGPAELGIIKNPTNLN